MPPAKWREGYGYMSWRYRFSCSRRPLRLIPRLSFTRTKLYGVTTTTITLHLFTWFFFLLKRDQRTPKPDIHRFYNCPYGINCKKHRDARSTAMLKRLKYACMYAYYCVWGVYFIASLELGVIRDKVADKFRNRYQTIVSGLRKPYRKALAHVGQWIADRLGDYPWSSKCSYCGWEWHGPLRYMYDEKGIMTHDCSPAHKTISQLRVSLIREFNRRLDTNAAQRETNEDLYILLGAYDKALEELDATSDSSDGADRYHAIVQRVADEILSELPREASTRSDLEARGRYASEAGIPFN